MKVGDIVKHPIPITSSPQHCCFCNETKTSRNSVGRLTFECGCKYNNLRNGTVEILSPCTRYQENKVENKENKENGHLCNCSHDQIMAGGCICGGL